MTINQDKPFTKRVSAKYDVNINGRAVLATRHNKHTVDAQQRFTATATIEQEGQVLPLHLEFHYGAVIETSRLSAEFAAQSFARHSGKMAFKPRVLNLTQKMEREPDFDLFLSLLNGTTVVAEAMLFNQKPYIAVTLDKGTLYVFDDNLAKQIVQRHNATSNNINAMISGQRNGAAFSRYD